MLIAYLAATLNVGYYSRADLFGPVSKFPTVFVILAVSIALAMAYVFQCATHDRRSLRYWLFLVSPIVLLILYMVFLPDATENYVLTNYFDVIDHMARATYVLATGHSNIHVDSYFDMQPAVFYATAAFLTVTRIDTYAIFKWFPLFFVIIAYVPSLVFLGKSFFDDPRELALFVFLSLATMWVSTRYHYSAQVYVLPLYNIFVALLARWPITRGKLVVIATICLAIVPTHQGVSLFVMATFVSVVLLGILERSVFGRTGRLITLRLAILFSIVWLAYLGWVATYTFGDFMRTLKEVGSIILTEPFSFIFWKAIGRPDPTYQLLVYGKVLITVTIYLLSLPVLGYCWFKKRMRGLGTVFVAILGVSATIFVLGFVLGGAGFVERAVLMTGPLLAIGLTIIASRIGRRSSLPIAFMLIFLTVTGTVLFNSSRNFESRTFSEQACNEFLISNGPSHIPGYSNVTVTVARYSYGYVENINKTPTGVLILFPSYLIESSYWVPEDVLANVTAGPNRTANSLRFYSNGVCPMYLMMNLTAD